MNAEIINLRCGGRLAVEMMPSMESFTLGIFLPVGSAFETVQQNGVSHFIEHMLFKGTKRRNARQIVKSVERVGGLINASTGKEVTNYFIRISASKLDLALDVLTDLVFNPEFEKKALEREKGVVLEEKHMNEDDPGQALYDRFMLGVHGNTAYGRPILGSFQSISSFSRTGLLNYHKKYYTPSRMVASIAGGVDADKVRSLLEKKLKCLKIPAPENVKYPRQSKYHSSICVYSKDVEQSALIVGFPSASVMSPDRYAYSLLDAITAGGMMSRLFQEIREKRGLVYSVDSSHQPSRHSGLFTVEAGMREENLIIVLKLILKELASIARKGPGERELADAKLYLKGHWALGLESTSARMIRNAMSTLFFGRIMSHDEVVSRLDAVTVDDVTAAANRCFENGGPAIGALSKFENGGTVESVKSEIEELREKARGSNSL